MNWSHVGQGVSDGLAIVLIIRLSVLRLRSVYRVLCVFLLFELFASLIIFLERLAHDPRFDYRLTWIGLRVIAWILSLWMVYALLEAALGTLPGILRFSRRLLNSTFLVAVAIALVTAKPAYPVQGLPAPMDSIERVVRITFVLERIISMTALLALVAILAFILWFPVQMPRNLAVFSFGFVVYFAAKAGLLLAYTFWSPKSADLFSNVVMFVLAGCFAYWTLFITSRGEKAPVTLGHSWHSGQQQHLLNQLEAMNSALARGPRRHERVPGR